MGYHIVAECSNFGGNGLFGLQLQSVPFVALIFAGFQALAVMAFKQPMLGAELALAKLAVAHHSQRGGCAGGEGALFRLGLGSRLGLGLLRGLLLQDEVVRSGFRPVVDHCAAGRSRLCAGQGVSDGQMHHQVGVHLHAVWVDVVARQGFGIVQPVATVPQVYVLCGEPVMFVVAAWQRNQRRHLQVFHGGVIRDGQR